MGYTYSKQNPLETTNNVELLYGRLASTPGLCSERMGAVDGKNKISLFGGDMVCCVVVLWYAKPIRMSVT
jgi:hypothetical protein